MEVQWNTGRKYTAAGQIIKARVQADGSILFVDISRQVDGLIEKPSIQIDSEQTLKLIVMRAYDSYQFRSSEGSWMWLMHPSKEIA
jgi:hypothetical protein